MNIVLMSPSGAFASALHRLEPAADDTVVLVSRDAPDVDTGVIVRLAPRLAALTARASRSVSDSALGRNLLRLSPLDPGHRFAGAARRHPELRALLSEAQLIAVLERDAILAGRTAAVRWAPVGARVVYGLPAASAALTELRDQTR